jgi:tetratricopeptide (TPR) repeat protein
MGCHNCRGFLTGVALVHSDDEGDPHVMAIDPYAACPGGKDKKIKFCCSDLVGELEQLDKLIEGEQISAALEKATRLDAAHPGRACLLAAKTKLQLSARKFDEAMATNRAFLAAFPENPLALAQSAICSALTDNMQESAAAFDAAREHMPAEGSTAEELTRIAFTLIQAAAQAGQVGMAQGLLEWADDRGLGSEDDRQTMAAMIGREGVPPALRARPALKPTAEDSPWRFEFQTALKHADEWRLSKALKTFRTLKGVAGECRELFSNIAILCEKLARPFEAAEAWVKVAGLPGISEDEAIEAIGRAIVLEQEANPERSPTVPLSQTLMEIPATGSDGPPLDLDLVEDKLRHDGRFESVPFDRSNWVNRSAVPPRSVWRVYDAVVTEERPALLLASLLIFGRQTDRAAHAVLQGFGPDLAAARETAEPFLHGTFGEEAATSLITPTNWLLAAQYRPHTPSSLTPDQAADSGAFDTAMRQQREAVWNRFVAEWPATPLPELLGRTPREAVGDTDGRRRVAAMLQAGEVTAQFQLASDAWAKLRSDLGLAAESPVESAAPVEELPPMRWHRVVLGPLSLDQLRLLLEMSIASGFELSAMRAANEMLGRAGKPESGAEPMDEWRALGYLQERAETTTEKLEILGKLRKIASALGASEAMLDVAELRLALQRGDQLSMQRMLDRIRRGPQDQRVLQAVAAVFAEAGIDLSAMAAAQAGGMPQTARMAGAAAAPAPPASSGLWTPGSDTPPAADGGEKKTIWTPGS